MKLTNLIPALIADLRSKRLLPVVAILIVALIAIPIALSSSSSSPPVPTLPGVAGIGATTPSGVPAVRVTKRSTKAQRTGRAHDPFVQQLLPRSGSRTATGTSATTASSTARSGSTSAATGTASSNGSKATSTVTTTVTTPAAATPVAAAPVYVHYAVKLSFGAAGTRPHVYNDPARFTTAPSLRRLAIVFLGVGSNGRTAEFLVANQVSPAGQGHCTPSRTHCVFLYMKPGQEEIFLNGRGNESMLRYLSVAKHPVSASSPGAVRVSRDGRRVVSWVGQLLPSLRRLHYGSRTGLLESQLAVPAARPVIVVLPVGPKRVVGWPR